MTVSSFFNSIAGSYAAQSFCHSIVAAILSEQTIKAWNIENPRLRQHFRLFTIIFPILSYPLFQLINQDRRSALFRINSLFDISRWLALDAFGLFPLGYLLLVVLVLTSLVFLVQEMFPVMMHAFDSGARDHGGSPLSLEPFLENASYELSIKKPEVIVLDEEEPLLFSSTGRNPVIYLSSGLTCILSADQLQAALAHEMAHIARSRRPLLIAVFVLRGLMFFNPVTLVKFRQLVRDEEKICDDIAVSLTGDPAALAAALKIFHHPVNDTQETTHEDGRKITGTIEDYSHSLQLESRIRRLETKTKRSGEKWRVPFALMMAASTVICYFIV